MLKTLMLDQKCKFYQLFTHPHIIENLCGSLDSNWHTAFGYETRINGLDWSINESFSDIRNKQSHCILQVFHNSNFFL